MKLLKNHEKRRLQVSFRIGEETWERLTQVARLFEMKESQYAKAVLMKDLGVFSEPLDRRRLPWRVKRQQAAAEIQEPEGEE